MRITKKIWLTPDHGSGSLCNISLESANPDLPIHVHESRYPANPTPEHPLRHVVVLGLFDMDDLIGLHAAVTKELLERGTWLG